MQVPDLQIAITQLTDELGSQGFEAVGNIV